MFVSDEAEELVFDGRATERKSVVIVAHNLLRLIGRDGKGVGGAEGLIAVEVIGRAMPLIGSRFEGEIDAAARIAAGLGASLSLHRKLLYRVDRKDDAGNARDTALIDCRDVVPKIVVINSVDLPVNLVRTGSVQRAVTAGARVSKARSNNNELSEVTTVERRILQLVALRLRLSGS